MTIPIIGEWRTDTPPADGRYLAVTNDGYTIQTLDYCEGWNCHRQLDGTVYRDYEMSNKIERWAEVTYIETE